MYNCIKTQAYKLMVEASLFANESDELRTALKKIRSIIRNTTIPKQEQNEIYLICSNALNYESREPNIKQIEDPLKELRKELEGVSKLNDII